MRLSKTKYADIYYAIHDPIIDVRIFLSKQGLSAKNDAVIAKLVDEIFKRILISLKAEHK